MTWWLPLLSCRDAIRRLHTARDESRERMPLACVVHLGLCGHCRRHWKQIGILHRALHQLDRTEAVVEGGLTENFKEQLLARLREK
jgi:predicted anti-sigma-YlaC factor YlaD